MYLNRCFFSSKKKNQAMLHYLLRDIGVIHELETFISNSKPTVRTVKSLSIQFPEILEPDEIVSDNEESFSNGDCISFPHIIVGIIGHAGTGKSNILKHIANRDRTMFYAPTNAAGINLQNILWPAMLYASSKKNVYRTVHSFYNIQPEQSRYLGECVYKARKGNESFVSYNEYLQTMFEGCKSFCEEQFVREMNDGKLSPESYLEHKERYLKSHTCDNSENVHAEVIRYLYSIGLESKVPSILLFDTCVLEEAGRCADYLTFLFLFYFYYMHVKYKTQAWKYVIPALVFVGSATQSRVIDKFTPFSALTYLSQPCMKRFIEEQRIIKIKCFKENRRMTSGNIEKNTVLATVVSKLESRLSINEELRNKFNSFFVIEEEKFFDPFFKPSHFRIAKKHDHLRIYKMNVFKYNKHNSFRLVEYLYSPLDFPKFTGLERYINAKFRSESFEEEWKNIRKKTKLWDQMFNSYATSRTMLVGFRYLLTEFHNLYIKSFAGTIKQFLQLTELLQQFIVSNKSSINCVNFFIECGKYLIECVFCTKVENVIKGLEVTESQASDDTKETSIQTLLSLKALLQAKSSVETIFMYANEKSGTYIGLPKDIFSFIITDAETSKYQSSGNSTTVHLLFENCLSLTLYPKYKSVSTNEISESVSSEPFNSFQSKASSYFSKKKRKRLVFEYDDDEEDNDIQFTEIDSEEMSNYGLETHNKSFFKFIPLTLYICSTIDCTQGLTIHSPILALLRKEDRAEDIIVALTRTSNPDTLLVANKIFDYRYEPISTDTKTLVREINKAQRKDGWL